MRCVALLLAVAASASCAIAPRPTGPDPRAEQKYAELIAGKVPAEGQSAAFQITATMT